MIRAIIAILMYVFQLASQWHEINCDCFDPRSYQIGVHGDTTRVYDGDRLIGTIVDKQHSSPLDDIIEYDNDNR